MDIGKIFADVITWLGPQIVAVLGLTIAQVILAVSVAIKSKIFEWSKLGDFFATIILPKLGGWLATVVIVKLVPPEYLPVEIGSGIQTVAFTVVIASFVGAIVGNLRALGILSDSPTLDKFGLSEKIVK